MIFLEARDIKKGKYTKALIQKMRSEFKCYGMFVVPCYLANPQTNTRNIFSHILNTQLANNRLFGYYVFLCSNFVQK